MKKNFKKALDLIKDISDEDIAKYFPKDTTPKGWISIEDYLPKCLAMDFITQGYSVYKVRNEIGEESLSRVADHDTWYYRVKEDGITHWLNE